MIKWRKTKEKVSETVENVEVVETVQEETSEKIIEEVSEETVEEVSEETVEETTEETVEEVSEKTAEEVSEEISEELKEISEEIKEEALEVSKEASDDDTSENILEELEKAIATENSEEATEEVVEETTEEVVEEVAKETAEDATVEDTPTETEESQEEQSEEQLEKQPKEKKKISKKAIIIISAVAAVLIAAYLGVALYFSNYFLMKTSVNGVDCTGKTVKEVKNLMQSQVEKYSLTVEGKDGATEEIKGVDIGIQYIGADVIEDAFEKQNTYAWIISVFKENNMKVAIDFKYDSEKLDEAIAQLSCMKAENQVAPASAIPVYQDGTYVIQEEVHGTQLHSEKVQELIRSTVDAMETKVNLEENDCYVLPTYTKDSAEVIAAKDALNKCLETNITYSLEGVTLALTKDMVQPWLGVDENMAVVVNADQVRAFVNTVSATYNTPNTVGEIVTPNGKVAHVPNGRLGRVVGAAAECDQLMNEIRSGAQKTREPILSQRGTPEGTTRWGATYIEVDITQQHMWYVVDGTSVMETDIITGLAGKMDTPVGIFNVLEKLSPKVLRGNIVPETGQPEYITPVDYWLRVTWSGVGFHDCTWHAVFGGEIYKAHGSHGCINMPPAAAATLYSLAPVGCPIIIHH